MRITEFTISNNRSIRLAACPAVPQVMIVTGPNGCGKSTLLDSLRHLPGTGPILYVAPHRTSRRQRVQLRHLLQPQIEMSRLLAAKSLPGFEGITLTGRERDAWNFDEAGSYLKYSLCQVETSRQAAITHRLDEIGKVVRADIPDVWEPLRRMTENLLPHLHFQQIDITNRDQVQCIWLVHAKNIRVDLDDLSSGEKAIIQLFFPLIQHQVQAHIDSIEGAEATRAQEDVAVLIDEPDLHLHPNLQGKLLTYLRNLALRDNLQIIIATHSPTIVEQANSDELYLLRPSELVGQDENQLKRIASDDERLAVLRDVFGSTSNITAMRHILVVEGSSGENRSRVPADARIYGFLSDRFGQITLVAGGGKDQCEKVVESLNTILRDIAPHLKAVALLDLDVDTPPTEEQQVMHLPVSMVENLLVDPKVIWDTLVTVRHKTELVNEEDVATKIDEILDGLEQHETDRRIKAGVGHYTFRLRDSVDQARRQVDEFVESLTAQMSDERLETLRTSAVQAVDKLREEKKRREFFDGKRVLEQFFKVHLHATGMSKEIFVYECARQASSRRSVTRFVDALFAQLGVPMHRP